MSRLAEVLGDLRSESEQLDDLVAPLTDEQWRTPTPAAGWGVAHQVAHLAWTDESAVQAMTDERAWEATVEEALARPDRFVDDAAAHGAAVPSGELLARWRTARLRFETAVREVPDGSRIPWYGPPMSPASMATARFMETWAHARDVAAGLGVELPADDRVRHVVHLGVRTRGFAYQNRGLPAPGSEVRVRLTLPGGEEVAYGDDGAACTVTGSAYDFALVVTQRLHVADARLVVGGADAQEWLSLAQAFAGPPGPGRPATSIEDPAPLVEVPEERGPRDQPHRGGDS